MYGVALNFLGFKRTFKVLLQASFSHVFLPLNALAKVDDVFVKITFQHPILIYPAYFLSLRQHYVL